MDQETAKLYIYLTDDTDFDNIDLEKLRALMKGEKKEAAD